MRGLCEECSSLRDQFAMAALPMAYDAVKNSGARNGIAVRVAACAYEQADAMMEARNQ